jgi:hypothetical protein
MLQYQSHPGCQACCCFQEREERAGDGFGRLPSKLRALLGVLRAVGMTEI